MPTASTAAVLLSNTPQLSAENEIDWTTAAATLKPKKCMLIGLLASTVA